jgi:seryl-tRNA synthetase
MIDIKLLRENPARFALGAKAKNIPIDIERILKLDVERRQLQGEGDKLRAEQGKFAKESGPQIGKLKGQLKGLKGADAEAVQKQLDELSAKPLALKSAEAEISKRLAVLDPELNQLLLQVPLPPDSDVPIGASAEDNVEISRWSPDGFDTVQVLRERSAASSPRPTSSSSATSSSPTLSAASSSRAPAPTS